MKRQIKLSEGTELLLNALLDLEELSGSVYSFVRKDLTESDSPEDPTGNDIVEATNKLREVISGYLTDRVDFGLIQVKNISSDVAVL